MVPMKMTAAKAPAQIMRFTLNFWAAAEGGNGGGEALFAPRPRAAARVAAEAAVLAAARAAGGVGIMVKGFSSSRSINQSQYWRHRMAQSLILFAAGGRDNVPPLPSDDEDDDDDDTDGERSRESGTVLSLKGRLLVELQLPCLTLPGVSVAWISLRQALMSLAF